MENAAAARSNNTAGNSRRVALSVRTVIHRSGAAPGLEEVHAVKLTQRSRIDVFVERPALTTSRPMVPMTAVMMRKDGSNRPAGSSCRMYRTGERCMGKIGNKRAVRDNGHIGNAEVSQVRRCLAARR